MVNNELCAPVILSYISKYFKNRNNYFSIRILFLPETIGSIAYLNKNLKYIKKNFIAGFHVSCFGDKCSFSMISTKYNNSYSDQIAKENLRKYKNSKIYEYKYCGSDERQYNFPGINIPIVTLTRSKFGKFKEYHNSMDNLKITNPQSLQKSYDFLVNIILQIEKEKNKEIINYSVIKKPIQKKSKINNYNLKIYSKTKCEPFLSKRNLYRNVSNSLLTKNEFIMFNLLYYGDGIEIFNISKIIKSKPKDVYNVALLLKKNKLIDLKFN